MQVLEKYLVPSDLKQLGHFFQNVIVFSDIVSFNCNISVWNWYKMNIKSALYILII